MSNLEDLAAAARQRDSGQPAPPIVTPPIPYAARLPRFDSDAKRMFKMGFFGGLGFMTASVAVWLAAWVLIFIFCGVLSFIAPSLSRMAAPRAPFSVPGR